MIEQLPPTHPRRRAVLGAAVWSVPAVTLASAAPAFADSGSRALAFTAGSTGVNWMTGVLQIDGSSIAVTGVDAVRAVVTMTVTFEPATGGSPPDLFARAVPELWAVTSDPLGSPLTYQPDRSVYPGGPMPINGARIERTGSGGGVYHLVFTADGYESTTASFPYSPV